jgi:uncharacterized integral membrane protein
MLRWITAAVLMVFLLLVLMFALQNMKGVEIFFLSWSYTVPKAALIVGSYVLGMATGSALFGFVFRSVRRLRAPAEHPGA